MRAGLQQLTEWIKKDRYQKVREVMKRLTSKLRGTWNYYGVIGNSKGSAVLGAGLRKSGVCERELK